MDQPLKSNTTTTKHKGKVMLVFLLFITIIGVSLLFGLLYLTLNKQEAPKNDAEDESTDESTEEEEDSNTIDLENAEATKYKYAAIKKGDTIALYTNEGEELIINLTKRSWKDIKWSTDGSYVSALGKMGDAESDIFDLFVYDFKTDEWTKVTNFSAAQTGVSSYQWKNDTTLFFQQGIVPDNWLHSYDYTKQAEVLKIDRIDGQILKKSPDETYLLYKMNSDESLKIFDFQGDEIWDLKNIKDQNDNALSNFGNLYFTKDETKVILERMDSESKRHLYKANIGEDVAVEITLEYEYIPVCAVNNDVVAGYTLEEGFNVVSVINYNVKTLDDTLIAQKDFTDDVQVIADSFECLNKNNILFRADDNLESNWYSISNANEIDKSTFLQDALEIDTK